MQNPRERGCRQSSRVRMEHEGSEIINGDGAVGRGGEGRHLFF